MTCDVDKEVMSIAQNFPYIVMLTGDENIQFLLVAERKALTSTDNFMEILTALVAAYFTFNIEYPKALYPIFIFLQHFVMELKDCQSVPNALTRVLSSLDRL